MENDLEENNKYRSNLFNILIYEIEDVLEKMIIKRMPIDLNKYCFTFAIDLIGSKKLSEVYLKYKKYYREMEESYNGTI